MVTSVSTTKRGTKRLPSHNDGSKAVLIVDDHPLTRDGLRQLVSEEHDLFVCGEAATIAEARTLISELQPHLILLDFDLPDGDCFTFLQELSERANSPRTIVLCGWNRSTDADATALRLGASAFLSKQDTRDHILRVIRDALQGRAYLSPEMIGRLLNKRSR